MFYESNIEKILFLDIETVPANKSYLELEETTRKLWDTKCAYLGKGEDTPESLYERAGIYAEFGKIVCISVGYIREKENGNELRLKSFFGHNEKELLTGFKDLLDNYYNTEEHLLCGHNGKEFDFPYIARRMLLNKIKLPSLLNIAGKKPWAVNHLDTMELWKFGDYKHYTSLNLLTHIFGIPTPKDDISGADVGRVYWEEKDVERIAMYCEKDVKATAQLFLAYRGEEQIADEMVFHL